MPQPFSLPRWSPYVVGAGIGMLSWATFYFMNKALGTSTSFVQAAGVLEAALISPEHVRNNEYFAKQLVGSPAFDWQAALVIALIPGAWLAARLSGSTRREYVPSIWAERFGPSRTKRAIGAFIGGVIVVFGARMAGGCTSGHGISGGLQLAVSSLVFTAALFISGIAAAMLIYRSGPFARQS